MNFVLTRPTIKHQQHQHCHHLAYNKNIKNINSVLTLSQQNINNRNSVLNLPQQNFNNIKQLCPHPTSTKHQRHEPVLTLPQQDINKINSVLTLLQENINDMNLS